MRKGFTLLEMSLVLVITSLLVAGIVVGRALITAASIRATVTQIEKFNAARNAFMIKYGYMPGDMCYNECLKRGFSRNNVWGISNNGLLELEESIVCGDKLLFWSDLSYAKMLAENYEGQDGYSGGDSCVPGGTMAASKLIPVAKIGNGNFITVYGRRDDRKNYYQIFGLTGDRLIGENGYVDTSAYSITPAEAYQIDSKMDDGKPLSGFVTAVDTGFTMGDYPLAATPAVPANGVCVSNAADNPFNTTSSGGDSRACSLRIRFN
jgi:prepilin-type N-terminal cleavage/methylation domain-containing protein